MRNKIGTGCMALGALLVLAAFVLWGRNQYEADRAAKAAEEILEKLTEQIKERVQENRKPEEIYPDPYDEGMTEVEIDGYFYIGYLQIPSLQMNLPVMSEWDYPRLRISPCRYSGSVKTDNLVVAAHNYACHFGGISTLAAGNEVNFIDMDGRRHCYQTVAVDILAPTAVEEMTAGTYDLTLFTCTYGGQSRVTVRCERTEDGKN